MSTFRIIAFDGGGIRGALSARLLKRLCEKYPTLLNNTQMFSGTSTGALIALCLAYGKDSIFIDNMYSYENVKNIFSPSHFNFFRPKYTNKNLIKVLDSVFPNSLTLEDLSKYVFIPAFHTEGLTAESWQAVFFNNLTKNITSKYTVKDVALASSAAPTYFPSHKGFIDGGIVVNSPTAVSMISTIHYKSIYSFSDFRVLSIGTGVTAHSINRNTSNWGATQWTFDLFGKIKSPLVSILLNEATPLEHWYCKELLGKNYFRLNPLLENSIGLDNYKKVPYLKEFADNYDLTNVCRYIENYFLR